MQRQFTTTAGWKNDYGDALFVDGLFADVYGSNSGNNIFSRAINRTLRHPVSFEHIGNNFSPEDWLIWSPANYLGNESSPPPFSSTLLDHSSRLLVLGIGIQAERSVSEIVLKEETHTFLSKLFSGGARVISRGEITDALLGQLFRVRSIALGCPSILDPMRLISSDRGQVDIALLRKLDREKQLRIGLSFTGYIGTDRVRQIIFDAVTKYPCVNYIAQTEINFYRSILGLPFNREELGKEVFGLPVGFCEYFGSRKNVFFELCPDRLSTLYTNFVDLYISERIHGSILATMIGVPTVVVCSDLRTFELASLLGIPRIRSEELSGIDSSSIMELILKSYEDGCESTYGRMSEVKNNLLLALRNEGVQLLI